MLANFGIGTLGAGLVIGPIRRWLGAAIGRALRVPRAAGRPAPVVDLAPGEWRSIPDQELARPDRR